MTLVRLPFFVWSQLVTALLLLLAFPALQAAAVFQLMDRLAGTSFFMPSGLVIGGVPLQGLSGGGNPCSQLCGLGHYRMRGEYHIVSAEDWQRWLSSELARLSTS